MTTKNRKREREIERNDHEEQRRWRKTKDEEREREIEQRVSKNLSIDHEQLSLILVATEENNGRHPNKDEGSLFG